MTDDTKLVDRELSEDERSLARWMLLNGSSQGCNFLNQLDQARVGALCPCGCASIDFNIAGHGVVAGPLGVLGDFLFGEGDETSGVFIFEIEGRLAGIEVYSFGEAVHAELPKPSQLRPLDS